MQPNLSFETRLPVPFLNFKINQPKKIESADIEELIARNFSLCRLELGDFDLNPLDFIKRVKEIIGDNNINLENLQIKDLYLVMGCLNGNQDAWEIFCRRYKNDKKINDLRTAVYKSCCCKTHAREIYLNEIEGILFTKNILKNYQGKSSFRTYLYCTIKNYLQAEQGNKLCHTQNYLEEITEFNAPATNLHPEKIIVNAEREKIFQQLFSLSFEKISSLQKKLLHQYFFLNLTKRELAEMYNVHESNIGRRLNKILAKTRKTFLKLLEKYGYEKDYINEILLNF